MKLFTLIQLSILLLSCKKEQNLASQMTTESSATQSVTKNFSYLALGDSYTIGQSVDQSSAFPYQLKNALAKDSISLDPLTVIAQTGWTTSELSSAIKARSLNARYDIVTLLVGVNNQYRGYSPEEYRLEFAQLLNTAVGFAGGDRAAVFVLSIPDWGVTPYASGNNRLQIAKEIDMFNEINKQESDKQGVNYTNITDISRMAGMDLSLIASDGLHPSGKMYAMWVDVLYPKVKAKLSR